MADFGKYKLSFNDAKKRINEIESMNDTEFKDQIRNWAVYNVSDYGSIYKDIRTNLVETFKRVLSENDNKINYILDLSVGIELYRLLNPRTGFDIIKANDDDIWRYISVCVMPDLTFIRYPNRQSEVDILQEYIQGLSYAIGVKPEKGSVRIKRKRFYSHTRRIWLKTLWWYVHLGWQGDSEQTYQVLKNNGTNIISHFIERPGRGYRTQLFRSMLRAYSQLPEQKDSVFRAAAKLNLVKCVTVEPALTVGGEPAYAEKLFEEVCAENEGMNHAEGNDNK